MQGLVRLSISAVSARWIPEMGQSSYFLHNVLPVRSILDNSMINLYGQTSEFDLAWWKI